MNITKHSLKPNQSLSLVNYKFVNRNGKLKVGGKNLKGEYVEVHAHTKRDLNGDLYTWGLDSLGDAHHIYIATN